MIVCRHQNAQKWRSLKQLKELPCSGGGPVLIIRTFFSDDYSLNQLNLKRQKMPGLIQIEK